MKFNLARETLLTPLQQVIGVVEKKQTMPILSNVLIRLEAGRLEMTGSDLEMQLVASGPVETEEAGVMTLPARKLLDIVRLLPEGSPVQMDCKADRVTLRSGHSRFYLAALPADNYPEFDSGATEMTVALPRESLKKALDKTMFAMAQQDVRYYLNGLLLDLEGQTLRTVASDGHRLAIYQEVMAEPFESSRQVIVPRKGVQELSRLLGEADDTVTLQLAPNAIRAGLGAIQFSGKLVEGRYPDFRRVLPRELACQFRLDRDAFKQALSRVAILSVDKVKTITLSVGEEGLMTLKSRNTEEEEAEESLTVAMEGAPVAAGFNALYLLDAINHIDSSEVRLSFTEGARSCLIEDLVDERFKSIVMPMRL